MLKKLLCLMLCPALSFCFIGCDKKPETYIYDVKNQPVVSTLEIASVSDDTAAYIDVVVNEAVEIISKTYNCNTNAAKRKIKNYNIYTYLNKNLIKAMGTSYTQNINGTSFGCALCDLDGKLVAVYSASATEDKNFATEKHMQHSTMKPLSVYAPAIEKGIINWSTLTEDSPYKQLTNSKGVKYDWPSNATGKYSYKNITTYTALKESINTVAVKVLSKYGVNNSIDFLQKNFKINLSYEQNQSTIYGEDEVIGNIALGATAAGSTPIEMAGYYQIFATGGTYTKPCAIDKITDKNGKVIYKNQSKSTQIISGETSDIMNRLMRGVVNLSGTGKDAHINGIQTAGKTGTGSSRVDNWFVGITPEFSCAVWHSRFDTGNIAAKVFSDIVKNSKIQNTLFMTSPNVKQFIYCKESGMLLGKNCKDAEMGYFLKDSPPTSCNMH